MIVPSEQRVKILSSCMGSTVQYTAGRSRNRKQSQRKRACAHVSDDAQNWCRHMDTHIIHTSAVVSHRPAVTSIPHRLGWFARPLAAHNMSRFICSLNVRTRATIGSHRRRPTTRQLRPNGLISAK